MDDKKLNQAKAKFDKVIFDLWKKDSVLFSALSMLDKVPTPSYSTIGIDVTEKHRISLKYNPNFINSISVERLELVLYTEGMRLLLRHPTTRLKEPPNISYLASSLAINQLSNSDVEKLLQGIGDITPDPKRFGLKDNLAFEEYWRELYAGSEKTNQIIQQIWGSMSKEDKEKKLHQAITNAENELDNVDEHGYQQFANEKDAMKMYTDPNGNSNQGWGLNIIFDADIKTFINKVRHKTRMWGKFTANIQSQILALLDPKISCKDIIRKFGTSILTGKTVPSRLKINRRWDLERPGYKRTYKPHVIFAIDSSGSMSDEDLQYGFGIINRLLFFAKIQFVEFDAQIKKVEKNFHTARKNFHVYGRGGTNFEPIMTMADNEKIDGLIVFTDGCAGPPHKPKCKVLWLLQSKDAVVPVDWGMRTYLDRFEDNRVW